MMNDAVTCGAITEVLKAFSRAPGVPKQYVQDKIPACAEKLKAALSTPNSHIYVCGDSIMSNSVADAFSTLLGAYKPVSCSGDTHCVCLSTTSLWSL